jgi:hypothetical protein
VARGGGQQLPDGTVVGDGVVPRDHGPEPEPALVVSVEEPAQIALRLDARLLDVVEAVLVGLPDVHRRPGQRCAVGAGDLAGHQAPSAFPVQRDVVAELSEG